MLKNKLIHLAIIMDGNGRWAAQQHKPRIFGHQAGIKIIPKIILAALKNKIELLSLFAFSINNRKRPRIEVEFLIENLKKSLDQKTIDWAIKHLVKLQIIFEKENLDNDLILKLNSFNKKLSKINFEITVNIYFNYSGQLEIVGASGKMAQKQLEFSLKNFQKCLLTKYVPVDLMIRTSGENRISDFLLYQSSFSEFIFEKTFWPDYDEKIFESNLKEYYLRERRFGNV